MANPYRQPKGAPASSGGQFARRPVSYHGQDFVPEGELADGTRVWRTNTEVPDIESFRARSGEFRALVIARDNFYPPNSVKPYDISGLERYLETGELPDGEHETRPHDIPEEWKLDFQPPPLVVDGHKFDIVGQRGWSNLYSSQDDNPSLWALRSKDRSSLLLTPTKLYVPGHPDPIEGRENALEFLRRYNGKS